MFYLFWSWFVKQPIEQKTNQKKLMVELHQMFKSKTQQKNHPLDEFVVLEPADQNQNQEVTSSGDQKVTPSGDSLGLPSTKKEPPVEKTCNEPTQQKINWWKDALEKAFEAKYKHSNDASSSCEE